VSRYQGDIQTDKNGRGHGHLVGRFSIETFAVAAWQRAGADRFRRAVPECQRQPAVYVHTDGRWRAAVSVGKGEDGKPKRKVFTAATRHEVAEEMTAALRDQQRGINIHPAKQTVGAVSRLVVGPGGQTVRPVPRQFSFTSTRAAFT